MTDRADTFTGYLEDDGGPAVDVPAEVPEDSVDKHALYATRVTAGLQYLDSNFPSWYKGLNPASVNATPDNEGVLGILNIVGAIPLSFNDYLNDEDNYGGRWLIDHGFDVEMWDVAYYPLITELWRGAIQDRQPA